MNTRILFIASLLLLSSVSCWWDGGHMLVAEIAKQEIKARNATLFAQIEKYVTIISPLCDARSQDFVQAASWADDIKDDAMSFWYNWHFYDKPENPQGLYVQLDADGTINNSIVAVKRAIQELSRKYYYPIKNDDHISVQQALFMRLLIHIVGDMHQPLHNVNMFNYTYTTGDYGGNKEHILLLNKTSMILHSYFDSGALRLDGFSRPLNAQNQTAITNFGTTYRVEFPRSHYGDRLKINDTTIWTQESYNIAHSFIYPFVAKTNQITEDFDKLAYQYIKEQITLGGYRLSDILMQIFDPTYVINTGAKTTPAAPAAAATAANNLRHSAGSSSE